MVVHVRERSFQERTASLLTLTLVARFMACSAQRQPIVDHVLNRHRLDTSRATTLSALMLCGALTKSEYDPLIGDLGELGYKHDETENEEGHNGFECTDAIADRNNQDTSGGPITSLQQQVDHQCDPF